jgi:hypothetical protein
MQVHRITADMICPPSIFIFRTYQHGKRPRGYPVRTNVGLFCYSMCAFTAAAVVQDGTPENAELVHLDNVVDYTTRISSLDEVVGST